MFRNVAQPDIVEHVEGLKLNGVTLNGTSHKSDKVTPVERVAVRIANIVAAVAAVLLVLRAIRGPFELAGIWIRSPLTLETSFAIIAGVLLFFVCRRGEGRGAIPPAADLPLLLLALVWIAVAFSPNLPDPFVSDDYIPGESHETSSHPAATARFVRSETSAMRWCTRWPDFARFPGTAICWAFTF